MAYKTYLQMPAYVANGGAGGAALILAGAAFQIFDKADLARTTPLPTFYLNGQLRSSLVSNRDGVIPPFMLDGVEGAVWRNGELEGPLICLEGITGAPGSNVLPLRDALIAELMNPGEVKTYMDSTYQTAGLSDQLTAVQGTAASVEELAASVVFGVGSTVNDVIFTNNRGTTLWVAPFPCEIVWAAISFDYADVPASDTDYLTVKLVHQPSPAVGNNIAVKTTQASGGEPIVARQAWDFSQVAWTPTIFDAGDLLRFDTDFTGTLQLRLPATVTLRYRPL